MKIRQVIKKKCKAIGLSTAGLLFMSSAFAQDRLAGAMSGDVQDMLGGAGAFWKAFILIDIIFAAAALIKTKNPMVFLSVIAVALIPTYLINVFVF